MICPTLALLTLLLTLVLLTFLSYSELYLYGLIFPIHPMIPLDNSIALRKVSLMLLCLTSVEVFTSRR